MPCDSPASANFSGITSYTSITTPKLTRQSLPAFDMFSSKAGVLKKVISNPGSSPSSPIESSAELQLPPSPPLSGSQVTTTTTTSNVPSEAVLEILHIFRSLYAGTGTERPPWDKHRLLREEYTELLERLDEDEQLGAWVNHKLRWVQPTVATFVVHRYYSVRSLALQRHGLTNVPAAARYDYDYDSQHLIIRMNSLLHEKFIAQVIGRLKAQMTAIASAKSKLREIVDAIHEEGHWRLRLGSIADSETEHESAEKAYPTSRSADQNFRYQGAMWPSVVLEISYSQKRKDLPRLAYSYIRGSGGNIKVVVGLDIEYTAPRKQPRTKMATVSVWRYKLVKDRKGEEEGACVQVVKDEVRTLLVIHCQKDLANLKCMTDIPRR